MVPGSWRKKENPATCKPICLGQTNCLYCAPQSYTNTKTKPGKNRTLASKFALWIRSAPAPPALWPQGALASHFPFKFCFVKSEKLAAICLAQTNSLLGRHSFLTQNNDFFGSSKLPWIKRTNLYFGSFVAFGQLRRNKSDLEERPELLRARRDRPTPAKPSRNHTDHARKLRKQSTFAEAKSRAAEASGRCAIMTFCPFIFGHRSHAQRRFFLWWRGCSNVSWNCPTTISEINDLLIIPGCMFACWNNPRSYI